MNRKELEQMTQALADQTISSTEFESLQEELRADPASRVFFRESMEAEILLTEALNQRAAVNKSQGRMEILLHHRRRRDFYRALMATAAILVLAAVIMALVVIRKPDIPTLSSTPVPGTEWQVTGNSSDPDGSIGKIAVGSTVRVESGSVKLELESGVVMLLRGPAEASFPSLDRPVLEHGWLWVDSDKSDESFEVETPHQIVRDIGTRFGVRVRDNGDAEVHLVQGRLVVSPKRGAEKGKKLNLKPDDKGRLLTTSSPPSALPLAPDPFPDLPDLLNMAANYPTTVLSQGPEGYWRLENAEERKLLNEVWGGLVGKRGIKVTAGKLGVGSGESLRGFPSDNSCLDLHGDPLTSVLIGMDLPGGVSREEGGLSFWIRRSSDLEREEVLWLAGQSPRGVALSPTQSMIHTQLSRGGQIEFFMENGKYDIFLNSNFSVSDGHWHHIAASWSHSAVELYVDGRRVMRVDDFSNLQRGTLRGRYIRFGKPSTDLAAVGKHAFSGQVDEIALWTRPLSSIEVAHQYRAALGEEMGSALTD